MAEEPAAGAAIRIFVSYRRADSAAATGRIVDRLVARYGAASVFMDVDSMPYGVPVREHIRGAIEHVELCLAVIGAQWSGASANGSHRIADPEDFVRLEIEIAIGLGLPIIPVLVDGAAMPSRGQLPGTLEALASLNAASVANGRDFHVHVDRLIQAIDARAGQLPVVTGPDATQVAATPRLRWPGLALRFAPAAGLLVLPFLAELAVVTPPWPRWSPPMTAALAALAMVATYRSAPAASARWPVWLTIAATTAVFLAAGYALGVAFLTYQTLQADRLWAKGLECTHEALLVYKADCPWLGTPELASAEYAGANLWTGPSIALVESALSFLWFGAFVAAAVFLAALDRVRSGK
jgi:hypothetical protein